MNKITPLLLLAWLALLIVQVAAYMEGMELWLGWNPWVAFFALVLAVMFLRDLAAFAASIIAFIGAWKGFEWAWWQAFLLCFPFIALQIVFLLGGGVASAVGGLNRQRSAQY